MIHRIRIQCELCKSTTSTPRHVQEFDASLNSQGHQSMKIHTFLVTFTILVLKCITAYDDDVSYIRKRALQETRSMLTDDDSINVINVRINGVREQHGCQWLRTHLEQKPFCNMKKVRDTCRRTCFKFQTGDDDSVTIINVRINGVREQHGCQWLRSQLEQKPFCDIQEVRDACRGTCSKFKKSTVTGRDDDSAAVIVLTINGILEEHGCRWLRSQIEQKPFCSMKRVRDACRRTCSKFA